MRPARLLLLAAAAAALAAAPAAAVKPVFTVAPAIDWEWTTHAALSVTAEIDVGGRLRCVALAPGADEPTPAEVAAGAYAFGATPPGSLVVSATLSAGVVRATIDFLAAETAYDVWCVADASGDQQVAATKATGVSVTAAAEAWQYTGDECVGARRNPVERLNTVVFVASNDGSYSNWDNDNVCPGGMHWATLQEFKDSQVGSQAFTNSQCVSQLTYHSQCGWTNYPTFGNAGIVYMWPFSDSEVNGQYLHSGNYPCHITTGGFSSSSTVFAGLVCLPGGGVEPPPQCDPADAPDKTPTFDVAASTIDPEGRLLLRWDSSRGYESHRFAFATPAAAADSDCSMQAPQDGSAALAEDEWTYADGTEGCDSVWTFSRALPETLAACGFETVDTDPAFTEYRATVEVTTVEDAGAEVFGVAVTQTRTTSTEFGVRVPKSIQVTSGDVQAFPGFAGLEVDGRTFAVVSTQAYNVDTETFTLRVITAVAWPYVLELDGPTPVVRSSGSNVWTLGATSAGGDCDSGAAVDNVCVQQWDVTLARVSDCEADGEYDLGFDVRCSDAFGNGDHCAGLENPSASVTIPVESDSVCSRVVEVATVTPTLVTSTSLGGAQATDFVLQTTLHGRVSVAAEGGVTTTAVALTDLQIVSDCSGCSDSTVEPLSDSTPAPSSYSWSTTPAAAHADFQFQLNANSVPFDAGAGQASLTLTATVAVTYDVAGNQRTETRRVRVQAGTVGETTSTSASTQIGVGSSSGATAGGSSSTTAGSTVLGVSTGTAMVAGVGLVAVVALAAGAVVVARKRRSSPASSRAAKMVQQQQSSSSGAIQLEVAPSAPAMESLGEVASAYGAIHVDV